MVWWARPCWSRAVAIAVLVGSWSAIRTTCTSVTPAVRSRWAPRRSPAPDSARCRGCPARCGRSGGSLQFGAVFLFVASVVSLLRPNNNTGLSMFVAVPTARRHGDPEAAFLRMPLGKRTMIGWVRVLLDGVTVAVAGGLIFWYVVLDLAPPGVPRDHLLPICGLICCCAFQIPLSPFAWISALCSWTLAESASM